MTPTYQPENWERFKERLSNEFSDEIQDIEFFDRVVRQKTPTSSNTGFLQVANRFGQPPGHDLPQRTRSGTFQTFRIAGFAFAVLGAPDAPGT